jgi:hypothetical protein
VPAPEAYLIAAFARVEIPLCYVKLLEAKRALLYRI